MNWITIICSAVAGASVAMALMHFLIWRRNRSSWANLCFFINVVGVLGLGAAEMTCMKTSSPMAYGEAVCWGHLAFTVLFAGSLTFVHFYFGTGRRWLFALALGVRLLATVANFTSGMSLHIRSIERLNKITLLGEPVTVLAEWQPNPWMQLGQFAALLWLAYVVDASIRLWRKGQPEARQRAVFVGGGTSFFIVMAVTQAGLVATGTVKLPFLVSFPFFAMVLAMGYELSRDALRATQLARDLVENEEQMNLAAKAANLGVWIRDLERNEIWATDTWRALLGFEKGVRLELDRVLQHLHPEDRETVRGVLGRAIEGDGSYEMEYRVLLPGGGIRWIASRGRVEFNHARKPVRVRGVSIDISGRKRGEEALRESEERFRLVVEASPNAMVMVNAKGSIEMVNTQAEKIFGYTRAELVGLSIEMLVPERARASHPGQRHSYFTHATTRAMGAGRELFGRRKDGSEVPVEIGLNPINSTNGLFVLASIVDISARKQTEKETQLLQREIEHVSRVTTMGQLAAALAHEINQPLGAILRNTEAAELFLEHESPDLDEIRAILADIRKDDQRASAVIDRMRTLLRRRDLQTQELDIAELVGDVAAIARPDASARGVKLTLDVSPELPKARGDRVHLQQVLLNLIINGMDALNGDTGHPKCVTVLARLNAEHSAEIAVSDSGPGIPADKLPHIFDPFFTTKPNGMGMGLAISRTIIEAHGGRLWAENNESRGATFRFTLKPLDDTTTA